MHSRRLYGLLIAALLCWPAQAQQNAVGSGVYGDVKVAAACTYTGSGDIVTFTAWYGIRAYNCAIAKAATQKIVNARNTATSETCDIIVNTSGGLGNTANCSGASNGTAAATFCAGGGGSCAVTKIYDQTNGNACGGASCDTLQGTAALQSTLLFSCIGSLPCVKSINIAAIYTGANNLTPATGTESFSVVADRMAGTQGPSIQSANGGGNNTLRYGNTLVNQWTLRGGATNLNFTATDNQWHASNAVEAGASSVVNVDGTETTGTATGNTTAGAPSGFGGNTASTTAATETGFIDNVSLSSGNRTSLCKNQQAYYGSGNFGATC